MEEHDMTVIEFQETFSLEWLGRKFVEHGFFGGVKKNAYPSKNGYLFPYRVYQSMEGYLAHMYKKRGGGVEPSQTKEYFTIDKEVIAHCKGFYVTSKMLNASIGENV